MSPALPHPDHANPDGDRPIIWTVSVSRLSELFRDITLEYDHLATIEPIDLGFDAAVRHIRERMASERCDVVIAAGSNAAYLKSRLAVPVVVARASGFDMMRALAQARRTGGRIGVITYQAPLPALAEFSDTFGAAIVERTYVTRDDARACIAELKAAGVSAIVGAGLITDLATEAGLHGVFVYSAASIRLAFDDALELARQTASDAKRRRRTVLADTLRARHGLHDLRGESAAMEQLRQAVLLFARSPATVLLEGETGTGKELAAQAIHREGPRSLGENRPFVAVNCGALAESLLESELFGHEEGSFTGARRGGHAGLFEAANQGTLFLDEIGEMPLALQTRLLRVLEEREVVRVGGSRPIAIDVRVISATHCDLEARVREGRFRADLYYRLAVLRLRLPPLRARAGDVPALAEWSLKHALAALGARPHPNLRAEIAACAGLFERYRWPGNVRELRNVTQRLALYLAAEPLQALTQASVLKVAPELGAAAALAPAPGEERSMADDQAAGAAAAARTAPAAEAPRPLPAGGANPAPGAASEVAAPAPSAAAPQQAAAASDVHAVLARFGGRRDAAAAYLGISRTTLWRRLRH